MPKKIENVRVLLMQEAKRLLQIDGYAKLTMRSVAAACGVGVGTVYNYFSSKDMLIASFVLDDWLQALKKMQQCDEAGVDRVAHVYRCLSKFISQNGALFHDESAKKSYSAASNVWHKQLREQLAKAVLPACKGQDGEEFLSLFIADCLLSWSAEEKDFSDLAPIMEKLLS